MLLSAMGWMVYIGIGIAIISSAVGPADSRGAAFMVVLMVVFWPVLVIAALVQVMFGLKVREP